MYDANGKYQPAGKPLPSELHLKHWFSSSVPTDRHQPDETGWAVVSADAMSVTVATMCKCGNADCAWTATASFTATLVWQEPRCIHEGVFSRRGPDGEFNTHEFCWDCQKMIPATEL